MVRNNKRRAFTIVELVIVIAVIAILAAVMIPTFGGIIKRANISADTQIAASMNTQLSIYKAEGKKIETEADLWAALKSDADFTSQLDPKSAKHGYHFWYDATKQAVELLTYDEVLAELKTHNDKHINQIVMMDEFAAGGDGEVKVKAAFNPADFAKAAPRSIVPGFYFLDMAEESVNEIADFFNTIAGMGGEDADYIAAIASLKQVKGDNANLAAAILAKMEATAIITNKGAYINVNEGSNVKVQHIYVPEKVGEGDYYLNHTVINVGTADVDNLLDVTNTANAVIELPKGVKVAEGSLSGFANATIKVNDDVANLSAIFSADSVAADATIVLNNGTAYAISGTVVTEKATGKEVATLAYKNPAESLDISVTNDSNIVVKSQTNYIALDKIKNPTDEMNLTLVANPKDSTGASVYATVRWSSETAGVTVDVDGTVTFDAAFSANTVIFNAEVDSTRILENGTVEKFTIPASFTVNVVRVKSASVDFYLNGTKTGTEVIANGGDYTNANFLVAYNTAQTTANFGAPTLFKYADMATGDLVNFTNEEVATLGCTEPTTAMSADGKYFTVGTDYAIALDNTKITSLVGSKDLQTVTVKVSDNAGEAFAATVNVTVNDNTNCPFEIALPAYKDHTYVVGNMNPLALGQLIAKRPDAKDLGEYSVYIFNSEADYDGAFHSPVKDPFATDADTPIDFAGLTEEHWVVLGTADEIESGDETAAIIPVVVVNGKNFTADDKVTNLTQDNGEFKYATYEYYNIVLHDDIDVNTNTGRDGVTLDGKPDIFLNNTALYGNYFKITAKQFKDDKIGGQNGSTGKTLMTDGHSLIEMAGTSSLNQVIIDGPLYDESVSASDKSGKFCFGILCKGTTTITDSYIYGFMSPVRILNGTLDMKNSVLESGTWANLFVYTASSITLDNSMTIQDYDGYTPTIGNTKKIIGLGIYLHDEMAGKNVEIIFKGDTKQINWFGENANFGGYAGTAKGIVFEKSGKTYVFNDFMHEYTYSGDTQPTKFVNAGIAFQCLLSGSTPNVNFTSTDWTIDGVEANITYIQKPHTVSIWGYDVYSTLVCSSKHEAEGGCDSCEFLNADMELDYGATWFYRTRVNTDE